MKDLEAKLEKHEFVDDMGALILALEIEGKAYSLYRFKKGGCYKNKKGIFRKISKQKTNQIKNLKKKGTFRIITLRRRQ